MDASIICASVSPLSLPALTPPPGLGAVPWLAGQVPLPKQAQGGGALCSCPSDSAWQAACPVPDAGEGPRVRAASSQEGDGLAVSRGPVSLC